MEEKDYPHKIVVVADGPTCTGFRLAGVQEAFKLLGKAAERKVEELVEEGEVGIVIINEKLLTSMDHRLRKTIDRIAKPVFIAVPDKNGPSADVESLKEMVKRALGFELKA
jgi:V/A-type H+-transporting ATPase subunit F